MKMAKKLLALVLTGVMAMSVLTGCGSTASRQAAGKLEGMLEGMLKEANPNATVEVGSEELANKAIEAQAIANEILKTETDGSVTIGTNKAVNFLYVGIPGKYNIKAGDEFVLSMKEFTVTNDDGTTTDWIMAVVTCKAVASK